MTSESEVFNRGFTKEIEDDSEGSCIRDTWSKKRVRIFGKSWKGKGKLNRDKK